MLKEMVWAEAQKANNVVLILILMEHAQREHFL